MIKIIKLIGKVLFIFTLFMYFLERKRPERTYLNNSKHDLLNVLAGITNKVAASLITKRTYSVLDTAKSKKFGILNVIKLPNTSKSIFALILIDLWMYWWHRMNHELPLLRRFHKFHHEDQSLNTTSAVRFHIIEIIISSVMRLVVFLTLGIERKHINIYEKILLPVISFNHSNIKLSLKQDLDFRKFIVSPEMHRTHHSTDSQEANSNYSSILPYWDIIFKTYTKFPKKTVEFGQMKK